ncbi:TRAP transporter small permease [Aquibacillus sediminis]|uniref:TRAP transporter small permease n=1 Tax=Aquibacillus sediminis TaxID=2574734 RepID=UPI001109BE0F|nr:TRAP transporter small permease [Aquibacillus sediminis]
MEKLIDMLSKGLHYVAQFVLFIMAIIVTVDVFSRWMFNKPITGTVDITELGLSMVIFLSLAYTHVKKEHITIDFIVEKFPKRIQLVFDSIINLVIAVLIGLVAWSLFGNAERLYASDTVTGDLRLPIYLFAILAAISITVFALTALLRAITEAQKVVKNDES